MASGLLSSLSGSLSTYLHRATGEAVEPFSAVPENESEERLQTLPAASPAPAHSFQRDPHTPEHSSATRYSPNSLSASSATMSGILSAHPHFSVFRKGASVSDELAVMRSADGSPLGAGAGRASLNMRDLRDEDEVEVLAIPPNQSPGSRRTSPRGDRSGSSETSEFRLSLDSAGMQSLNFGDQSSLSLSPAGSPAAATPPVRSVSTAPPAQASGVRLVPDSPPTTRTPLPRSRSSSTQSTGKMRTSTGPVQRVQFSPISSCPSPLLSASTLPPPPPPPPAFAGSSSAMRASFGPTDENCPPLDDARASTSGGTLNRPGSGILKHPRTPGTGRSVRFSASTVEHTPVGATEGAESDDSPSVAVGSRSVHRSDRADERDAAPSTLPEGSLVGADLSVASTPEIDTAEHHVEGDSSILVASFLSKLQAAIPSPDVSLVSSPPPPPPVDLPVIAIDPSTPGPPPALTLFDESNPFGGLNSALAASILGRAEASTVAPDSAAAGLSTLNASISLLAGRESGTVSASGTFLLQASLNGSAHIGAPSFGGQSFADVSALQPRLARPQQQLGVLEEMSEDGESSRRSELAAGDLPGENAPDASVATTLGPVTPRAPPALNAPLASTPSVPSPLRYEAADIEPLRASDLSSAASERDETLARSSGTSASPTTTIRIVDNVLARSPSSQPSMAQSPDQTASPPIAEAPASPAPATAQPSPATPASPAAAPSTSSASFYRQFMAARARDGLSQSAREEYSRLERGEKASPKDSSRVERDEEVEQVEVAEAVAEECADRTEASVYYSPQKGWNEESEDEVQEALVGGSAFVEVDNGGDTLAESSIVEHEGPRTVFLSPIVEVTEPESNANTPFDAAHATGRMRSRDPPPAQPSFAAALSSSLAPLAAASVPPPATPATPARAVARRAPSTPQSASKIPRPRNPITPSQNPFLLQLARTTTSSTQPQAVSLLQDLFSAQQDQLATSSSQRFLLSSLVTNLQNEVEHKDAMIRNLKEQVGDARSELKEVEQLALAWEERALRTGPATAAPPPSARKTSAALEETVQLLADELETRVREDRALRSELEGELERLRTELARRTHEVREGEIRLRYAQAGAAQAEEHRAEMKRELERGEERRVEVARERDELRARWAIDVEERERTLARLREEVQELKAASANGRGPDDDSVEREVQRRVEAAQAESHRQVQFVKHELVQRDKALADLRDQLHAQRNESDRLARAVQEERQHAELAHADIAEVLASTERELEQVLHDQDALQQDLDKAYARLERAELERDRLADAAKAKDQELAQQVKQCQTALAAMGDLESAVVRIEAEGAAKDAQLAQVQKELAQARRESADVLEKRDRVLAETEKAAGRSRKELDALQTENNRLTDLVGKLRRDSADREVKVTKLKKRAAELEEDVFGLNIALDAKQQEAAHWKRQMSHIKLERERVAAAAESAAPSTVTRTAFAPHVPLSAVSIATGTAKAARRTSLSNRLHATTPFPGEKQATRASSLSRRTSSTSIARRAHVVDPAISTDDEEHDLTLPPTANEETPSRAVTVGLRKSASTAHLGLGLGLPLAARQRKTSAPAEKENAAPAPARRREAVLA